MVQNLYKNWLLVSKITWGIWTTSGKQWKVQNIEIWWVTFVQKIHLSKKYILSAKTLYIEDLSNITFNYLCKNSPNSLCHFWNHKSFFTTQLMCILLAQTLDIFDKNIPSKRKFSDFLLLNLKFINFLMSYFKQKKSFSSKFGSILSVMRVSLFCVMKDNSFVFYTLVKNSQSKWNSQIFQWLGENTPNSLCHVWNYKSVFL